jgi:uncharacterized protein (UPF0276 family)
VDLSEVKYVRSIIKTEACCQQFLDIQEIYITALHLLFQEWPTLRHYFTCKDLLWFFLV